MITHETPSTFHQSTDRMQPRADRLGPRSATVPQCFVSFALTAALRIRQRQTQWRGLFPWPRRRPSQPFRMSATGSLFSKTVSTPPLLGGLSNSVPSTRRGPPVSQGRCSLRHATALGPGGLDRAGRPGALMGSCLLSPSASDISSFVLIKLRR